MTGATAYYDRWVNGKGMRLVELARRSVDGARVASSVQQAPGAEPHLLTLEPYAGEPQLRSDGDALAPVAHILVHGSVATKDACPFSDVDIAVILDDTRPFTEEQHARAVRELRRLLDAVFSYDGLMHHGLMFLPASALYAYDQRFLPLETLQLARVVHGPLQLRVWPAPPSREHFAQALLAAARSLRKRFADRSFCANDFLFKEVLSGALLMPARVLAAHGMHVYKRDSFQPAREYFDAKSWDLIARAEALRSTWIRPGRSAVDRAMCGRVHPYLRTIASRRAGSRLNIRRLSEKMIASMEQSADAFVKRIEELV